MHIKTGTLLILRTQKLISQWTAKQVNTCSDGVKPWDSFLSIELWTTETEANVQPIRVLLIHWDMRLVSNFAWIFFCCFLFVAVKWSCNFVSFFEVVFDKEFLSSHLFRPLVLITFSCHNWQLFIRNFRPAKFNSNRSNWQIATCTIFIFKTLTTHNIVFLVQLWACLLPMDRQVPSWNCSPGEHDYLCL